MRSTNEYVRLLRSHADVLRREFGMTAMLLFGSVARGEQHDGSDVDVFVSMPPTLKAVGGANNYLEDLLGCHVDMVRNHSNLTPLFLKQIERDGITIF